MSTTSSVPPRSSSCSLYPLNHFPTHDPTHEAGSTSHTAARNPNQARIRAKRCPMTVPTTPDPRPRKRRVHPNSIAAVKQVNPSQEKRIADFLATRGANGATTHEIAEALEMPVQSVSPAITHLREQGKARDSKRNRKSPHGRAASVWLAR